MSSQLSRSDASFSTLTRSECWDFPASFKRVAGILYMEWSLPRSLPAVILVLPLDGQEVIPLAWYFSPFFSSPEKCLFRHFFFVGHYCGYSLCFETQQRSKIFGLENHLSMYTQWPLLSHNLLTTLNTVMCSELVGCATVHTAKL
jgi:hypothetical protein